MTAVADDVILSAAELDLAVGELVDAAPIAPVTEAVTGPMIRIVKGSPTDADIAAIVSVLAAASAAAANHTPDRGPLDLWGQPSDMHRGTSPVVPYSYPRLSHLR